MSTGTPRPDPQGMEARLKELGIVPVIVIDEPGDAAPLADALAEGGLPCAEVTFRTPDAAEALRRLVDARDDVLAGAGTVLTTLQVDEAREAGAAFIVSPGLNPRVVEHCLGHGIPVFPGVCTPTEIEAALALGLTTVKFFPAEPIGGLPYLKAIAAPYGMLRFVPTGGIGVARIAEYLAYDRVVACGGSWMAPQDRIRAGDFEWIRRETARAVESVRTSRGEG